LREHQEKKNSEEKNQICKTLSLKEEANKQATKPKASPVPSPNKGKDSKEEPSSTLWKFQELFKMDKKTQERIN
jgi:hypothetical protein